MSASASRATRFAFSILVAAVVLATLYAVGEADWREMARRIASLPPATFAAALALHAAIYVARSERFRVLLPAELRPRRWSLLWVTSAHNLAVYLLPAKTGEATLPLYLNAACGTPPSAGIASLVVSRLLDLASLCALTAFATAVTAGGAAWRAPAWVAPVLVAALVASAAGCFTLASRSAGLVTLLERGARAAGLGRSGLSERILRRAEGLRDALRLAGAQQRGRAAALSFVVWILIFAFYVVLARGFGLGASTGVVEAGFGASMAVAMNLLPINSFAGLGTQEAGWVAGFALVGTPADEALASGIGAHLVQIFDTLLFGLIGHVAMGLGRRARAS